MTTLKPCPFCNGKAAFGDGEQKKKFGNEQIYCTSCFVNAFPHPLKEDCIDEWNTRPAVITPEMVGLAGEIIETKDSSDQDSRAIDLATLILAAAKESKND